MVEFRNGSIAPLHSGPCAWQPKTAESWKFSRRFRRDSSAGQGCTATCAMVSLLDGWVASGSHVKTSLMIERRARSMAPCYAHLRRSPISLHIRSVAPDFLLPIAADVLAHADGSRSYPEL